MNEVESCGSRELVEAALVATNVGEATTLCNKWVPVPSVDLLILRIFGLCERLVFCPSLDVNGVGCRRRRVRGQLAGDRTRVRNLPKSLFAEAFESGCTTSIQRTRNVHGSKSATRLLHILDDTTIFMSRISFRLNDRTPQ